MPSVDMSPHAVSRRLQQVNDLREVCLFLGGSRIRKPWGVDKSIKATYIAGEERAVYRTDRAHSDLSTEKNALG